MTLTKIRKRDGRLADFNEEKIASAIDKVEAYRPQNLFSDAVKGLNLYGAKVIRPKELYVLKAHK